MKAIISARGASPTPTTFPRRSPRRPRRRPKWPCAAGAILAAVLAPSGCQPPGPPATESTPRAADETRYHIFLLERRAGAMAITRLPGGERVSTFGYRDRGRGPELRSRATVGPDGALLSLSVTGTDYWNAAVDEELSITSGTATWRNSVESGRAPVTGAGGGPRGGDGASPGRGFYVPLHATPMDRALLVRALLAAPGGALPLLPSGRARIERAATRNVTVAGKSKNLSLYAIHGAGLAPGYVWLDDHRELFAVTGGWMRIAPEGWEAVIPELREREKAEIMARLRGLAARLPTRADGPIAIRNVAVFDARTGAVRPNMRVDIAGDTITAVVAEAEPARSRAAPEPALEIDGRGQTLLPGLWDMHAHIDIADGLLHIAAGVTTIRDLGNDVDEVLTVRKAFDSGEVIGPRLILAGIIDGTSEYTGPTKMIVDSEAQAAAVVARYAELGFEQIKIYSSIQPALVPAIVREAHARGLRVSGHVPAFMTAEAAVRQGFDELQHGNFLLLNFLSDQVKDTRTPARFTEVGAHAADLDLDSEEVQAFIRLLVDSDVAIDPTVAIFEHMFLARKGQMAPGYRAVADRLPVELRRQFKAGGLPLPDGPGDMDARHRASFRTMLDLVGRLHRAGVSVHAGTDALAGFTLHRELELYVAAGIPAPQVLTLATLGSATWARRDQELGAIEPGKLADLVLVAGNPAQRISDVRNTRAVIKGGVVYSPAELYRAIGVGPP